MSFSQGMNQGFRTLDNYFANQHQRDLQSRQFQEQRRMNKQTRELRGNQDERAQEQHRQQQEMNDLKMDELELMMEVTEDENQRSQELHNPALRQQRAAAQSAEASADLKQETAQRAIKQGRRGDADGVYREFRDYSREDILEDPMLAQSYFGAATSALDDMDDLGVTAEEGFSVKPVDPNDHSKGYYELRLGPDGVERVDDPETGEPSIISQEDLGHAYDYLETHLGRRANMADGGERRDEAMDSLVDRAVGQGPRRVDSPDVERIEGEIDERRSLMSQLQEQRDALMADAGADTPGGHGGRPQQGNPAGGPPSNARSRMGSGQRPERERTLDDLSPQQQEQYQELDQRIGEVQGELATLEEGTLPQARRAQDHNEQLPEMEQRHERRRQEARQMVRDYENATGEKLDPGSAMNLVQTGDPEVSMGDVREEHGEQAAETMEFFDDFIDDHMRGLNDDGEATVNDHDTKLALKGQTRELFARKPDVMNRLTEDHGGEGVAVNLLERARDIGRHTGTPNMYMALQSFEQDVAAEDMGQVMSHLNSQEAMGTDAFTDSDQDRLAQMVAEEVDAGDLAARGSDERREELHAIAGKVYQRWNGDRRTLTPSE